MNTVKVRIIATVVMMAFFISFVQISVFAEVIDASTLGDSTVEGSVSSTDILSGKKLDTKDIPLHINTKDIEEISIMVIVEGYEQSENGYKCTGYSEKDGKYSYEFVEYEAYNLSSGIIPDGCPIIVCELNETIELLSTQYSTLHLNQGGDFFYADLFDMDGNDVASYSPTHKQIYSGNKKFPEAGIYWFKVVLKFKDPSMPSWDGIPEVGKEYVAEKSYLFIIIMD